MAIGSFQDFLLLADSAGDGELGERRVAVRVPLTPGVGESNEPAVVTIPSSLPHLLRQLEERRLCIGEITGLGELLAEILLPAPIRDLFVRSLDHLGSGQGVRLRLQLANSLSAIPWEYLYLQRGAGEHDVTGFLALDPRVSIVRHQLLAAPAVLDHAARLQRLLVVTANTLDEQYGALDLACERAMFAALAADLPGLDVVFVEQATVAQLAEALAAEPAVVHFAGHGDFVRAELGAEPLSSLGAGAVVMAAGDRAVERADLVAAEQFAANLGGRGVQLAVLCACQSGRRDAENWWSSVVAALLEKGVPAAVAMQHSLHDESALAFSRSFYRALAAGTILDEAVHAGRLAVFNRWHPSPGEAEQAAYWRDWGAPVLYLRSQKDLVFPATPQAAQRSLTPFSVQEGGLVAAELAQRRRNLLLLRQQRAVYAAGEEPLRLLNQIQAEEEQIRYLEGRLGGEPAG